MFKPGWGELVTSKFRSPDEQFPTARGSLVKKVYVVVSSQLVRYLEHVLATVCDECNPERTRGGNVRVVF